MKFNQNFVNKLKNLVTKPNLYLCLDHSGVLDVDIVFGIVDDDKIIMSDLGDGLFQVLDKKVIDLINDLMSMGVKLVSHSGNNRKDQMDLFDKLRMNGLLKVPEMCFAFNSNAKDGDYDYSSWSTPNIILENETEWYCCGGVESQNQLPNSKYAIRYNIRNYARNERGEHALLVLDDGDTIIEKINRDTEEEDALAFHISYGIFTTVSALELIKKIIGDMRNYNMKLIYAVFHAHSYIFSGGWTCCSRIIDENKLNDTSILVADRNHYGGRVKVRYNDITKIIKIPPTKLKPYLSSYYKCAWLYHQLIDNNEPFGLDQLNGLRNYLADMNALDNPIVCDNIKNTYFHVFGIII